MDVPSSALRAFAEPEVDAEVAVAGVPGALASFVAEVLDGFDVAVVLGDEQGAWHVVSASSDTARELAVTQLVRGSGPCIDALRAGAPLLVADLAGSRRYRAFASAAAERAVSSTFVVPLSAAHVTRGALCVFGAPAASLYRHRRHVQALAELAALALLQGSSAIRTQRTVHELEHALAARITIEQAKGVLVERAQIDLPAAFSCLVRYARDWGVALEHLARDVVAGKVEVDDERRAPRATARCDVSRPPAASTAHSAAGLPSLVRR